MELKKSLTDIITDYNFQKDTLLSVKEKNQPSLQKRGGHGPSSKKVKGQISKKPNKNR